MNIRTQSPHSQNRSAGYGLLEILGGLAIVAVLAAVAVPSIIKGRKSAGVSSVVQTVATVQTALSSFTQKPGGLTYAPITSSATIASIPTTGALLGASTGAIVSKAATLDNVLIAEGFMESPINIGLGNTNNTPAGTKAHPLLWSPTTESFYCNPDAVTDYDYTSVPHLICSISTANVPGVDGTNYFLDASQTNLAANTRVVSLVIPNVQAADAAALENQFDNVSTATALAANTTGRVTYATPSATTGLTTVYVYVTKY